MTHIGWGAHHFYMLRATEAKHLFAQIAHQHCSMVDIPCGRAQFGLVDDRDGFAHFNIFRANRKSVLEASFARVRHSYTHTHTS